MAFKDLPTATMANLFSPWINEPKAKALFLSIPELAGIYAHVERAYQGVLVTLPPANLTSPELTALSDLENVTDARHDHLARGVALAIDGHREISLGQSPPDSAGATACMAATTKLFPEGLACITASYRAESGNAERLAKLLDTDGELTAFLKAALVKKGTTLLDAVKLWIDAGKEFGALEDKKDKLLKELGAAVAPSKSTLQSARNAWIRAANRIVDVLGDSHAPESDIEVICSRLLDAATKAGKTVAAAIADPPAPAAPPTTGA